MAGFGSVLEHERDTNTRVADSESVMFLATVDLGISLF
jgi:hypothetical protein